MICSESTSALGQPRLTNPTFGGEGVGTAGEMVCDIGWVRRIAVTMATNGDGAARPRADGQSDHSPDNVPRTQPFIVPRRRPCSRPGSGALPDRPGHGPRIDAPASGSSH